MIRKVAFAGVLFIAGSAIAQEKNKIEVHGDFEASYFGATKDDFFFGGHIGRALVNVSRGPLELTTSYYAYPPSKYEGLDVNTLAYHFGENRIRVGRFDPAIGQSGWYDQWRNTIILLPSVERWVYFGTLSLWQTSPGIEVQNVHGNTSVTLSSIDRNQYDTNRLIPRQLDRQALRIQQFVGKAVLGAGIYFDYKRPGDSDMMGGLDFRTGGSHWLLRGQGVVANKYDNHYRGFFLEYVNRPSNQDKLTLAARYDTNRYEYISTGTGYYGPTSSISDYAGANTTLGARYNALPLTTVSVNYIFGNIPAPVSYCKGWLFQIQRVYSF